MRLVLVLQRILWENTGHVWLAFVALRELSFHRDAKLHIDTTCENVELHRIAENKGLCLISLS